MGVTSDEAVIAFMTQPDLNSPTAHRRDSLKERLASMAPQIDN